MNPCKETVHDADTFLVCKCNAKEREFKECIRTGGLQLKDVIFKKIKFHYCFLKDIF